METKRKDHRAVYRKLTDMKLYLNAGSHDHPSTNKLSTRVHRARAVCDQDNLHAELVFLRDVFRQNGYENWQIHSVFNRRPNIGKSNKPSSASFLPYAGPIQHQVGRPTSQEHF
jgi:hypothetical protein